MFHCKNMFPMFDTFNTIWYWSHIFKIPRTGRPLSWSDAPFVENKTTATLITRVSIIDSYVMN